MPLISKKSVWLSVCCITFLLVAFYGNGVCSESGPVVSKTLVLTSRECNRMQPEIFHALTDAGRNLKNGQMVKFEFTVFNPYFSKSALGGDYVSKQMAILHLLRQSVPAVVEMKYKSSPASNLKSQLLKFITDNPDSLLGQANKQIFQIMDKYDFLIIESTAETVIHPIFYNPDVLNVEVGYATEEDIVDTLYGLFFLNAAIKQKKPMIGFCHGAQLTYLYAGGGLGRNVDYTPYEYVVLKNVHYPRKNPYGGDIEIWTIDNLLNARNLDDRSEYQLIKYPLPETFKKALNITDDSFINKDFNHTLAMTDPLPKQIEVLSYHPLSALPNHAYKHEVSHEELAKITKEHPEVNTKSIEKFKSHMTVRNIVDAFRYKTALVFQYHPQYTYHDLDTSMVFQYIIKALILPNYRHS